jgi:hypothetical protein
MAYIKHSRGIDHIVPYYAIFEVLTGVLSGSPSAKPASIMEENRFMLHFPLMFSHPVSLETLEEENHMDYNWYKVVLSGK